MSAHRRGSLDDEWDLPADPAPPARSDATGPGDANANANANANATILQLRYRILDALPCTYATEARSQPRPPATLLPFSPPGRGSRLR